VPSLSLFLSLSISVFASNEVKRFHFPRVKRLQVVLVSQENSAWDSPPQRYRPFLSFFLFLSRNECDVWKNSYRDILIPELVFFCFPFRTNCTNASLKNLQKELDPKISYECREVTEYVYVYDDVIILIYYYYCYYYYYYYLLLLFHFMLDKKDKRIFDFLYVQHWKIDNNAVWDMYACTACHLSLSLFLSLLSLSLQGRPPWLQRSSKGILWELLVNWTSDHNMRHNHTSVNVTMCFYAIVWLHVKKKKNVFQCHSHIFL